MLSGCDRDAAPVSQLLVARGAPIDAGPSAAAASVVTGQQPPLEASDEAAREPRSSAVEQGASEPSASRSAPPPSVDPTATAELDWELLCGFEIFQKEGMKTPGLQAQIPAEVKRWNGRRVSLTGYMLPVEIERRGWIRVFLLMRDLASCCFGGSPKLNEWIHVQVKPEVRSKYITYAKTRVEGIIAIEPVMEDGLATGLYRVEAEAITVVE